MSIQVSPINVRTFPRQFYDSLFIVVHITCLNVSFETMVQFAGLFINNVTYINHIDFNNVRCCAVFFGSIFRADYEQFVCEDDEGCLLIEEGEFYPEFMHDNVAIRHHHRTRCLSDMSNMFPALNFGALRMFGNIDIKFVHGEQNYFRSYMEYFWLAMVDALVIDTEQLAAAA